MRTNIVLDDAAVEEAMRLTGAKTKREAVALGLNTLIRLERQKEGRDLWGLGWDGDLDAMRRDR